MGSNRNHRTVLSAVVIGAMIGLTACSGGDGDSTTLPSARASERSVERPASREPETEPTSARPSRTESVKPTRSRQPDPTTTPAEPTATRSSSSPAAAKPTRTTTRPPTSPVVAAPPPPTPTTEPAQPTPAPAASTTAVAAAESGGIGPLGWFLLLVLLAALIVGGVLVYRSQRKSGWDTEARALETETRSVTGTRLPPVLTTTAAAQRNLAWPPVRAALMELAGRWDALAERAAGEARRNWSLQLSGLLQDLVAAVDAENEALALGQDWILLRPRVNRAEEALAGLLASQPQADQAQPEPPAAGDPWPPGERI